VLLVVFLICQALGDPPQPCTASTVTATINPTTPICGRPFTVNIQVTSCHPNPPTGYVLVLLPGGPPQNVPLTRGPHSAIATFTSDPFPSGTYSIIIDYPGNNNDYPPSPSGSYETSFVVPSEPQPFTWSYSASHTISSSTYINFGYQYRIPGDSSLTPIFRFQYYATVSYSCDNQPRGQPLTYITPSNDDYDGSAVVPEGVWIPDLNQTWQWSFTLDGACPSQNANTVIHIQNIQITLSVATDTTTQIQVQAHLSIPGEQSNQGNGPHPQSGPNLNLESTCPAPATACLQPLSGVESANLTACDNLA